MTDRKIHPYDIAAAMVILFLAALALQVFRREGYTDWTPIDAGIIAAVTGGWLVARKWII
jgi:hypothetical protein